MKNCGRVCGLTGRIILLELSPVSIRELGAWGEKVCFILSFPNGLGHVSINIQSKESDELLLSYMVNPKTARLFEFFSLSLLP